MQADPSSYEAYQAHFREAPITTLRDCLEFKSDRQPISIDEVRAPSTSPPSSPLPALPPSLSRSQPRVTPCRVLSATSLFASAVVGSARVNQHLDQRSLLQVGGVRVPPVCVGRWSRRPTSCRASAPAACRWAPSAARRTRPSPSPSTASAASPTAARAARTPRGAHAPALPAHRPRRHCTWTLRKIATSQPVSRGNQSVRWAVCACVYV